MYSYFIKIKIFNLLVLKKLIILQGHTKTN